MGANIWRWPMASVSDEPARLQGAAIPVAGHRSPHEFLTNFATDASSCDPNLSIGGRLFSHRPVIRRAASGWCPGAALSMAALVRGYRVYMDMGVVMARCMHERRSAGLVAYFHLGVFKMEAQGTMQYWHTLSLSSGLGS